MLIYCIRHGESESNANGTFPDDKKKSPKLTEKGISQAKSIGEELLGLGIEALYTSPMIRARQTAQYVANILKLEPIIDERLQEVGLGMLGGKIYATVEERDPTWYNEYFNEESKYGLEKFNHVKERAQSFIEYLYKTKLNSVAIVSHLDPIRSLISTSLGVQDVWLRHIAIYNASVTIFNYEGKLVLKTINWLPLKRYNTDLKSLDYNKGGIGQVKHR